MAGAGLPDGDVRVLVEAVAGAADRADDRGVRAQAAAQAADVDVDGAGVGALAGLRPQCVDEVLAGQGASGVGHERGEQVELLVRHVDGLAVRMDLTAGQVDADGCVLVHVGL